MNAIGLCFEHTRHKDRDAERRLLSSITQQGILDPLQIARDSATGGWVLLDGFKRYRCARKLDLGMAPVACIGDSVPEGVFALLRRNRSGGLSTMEQASMVHELYQRHAMSIYDIAAQLGHCPSWVSMRLNMLEDLGDFVRTKIMSGAFPARAYMYGIKGFTRVNKIPQERIEAFVGALSGKGLSTRALIELWRAYVGGDAAMERLIIEGDAHRTLHMLHTEAQGSVDGALDDVQRSYINDLKETATGMGRIISGASAMDLGGASFNQHVNLLAHALLACADEFSRVIRELYDRSGPAGCGVDPAPAGGGPHGDSTAVAH